MAIILEDISERRKATEDLRIAKERAEANEKELEAANQAKDRFLAVLSHELRTPLTPVMAAVQAMQGEPEFAGVLPWLDMIQRNVEIEARLIDDLLDLTRITRGKVQITESVVDIHELLHGVIAIYQHDIEYKGLELTVEFEASNHFVHGDPARLQQVFWNLIKNAVKFTPRDRANGARGRIVINTSNITQTDPDTNTENELLSVEISDNGIGIEESVLPRIFDAFEQGESTITRTFGGLGLGLAISKNLVDMQGGALTAISPGKDLGATFIVTLPTVMPERPLNDSTIAAGVAPKRSTILIVDDHVDTSLAVKMLLERQGYDVRTANSAAESLEIASTNSIDLVISDIGLPDESGLSLIAKIKAIHNVPAIVLSGFGTEEDVARSMAAGFQAHLTKPFNLAKLRETIGNLLSKT